MIRSLGGNQRSGSHAPRKHAAKYVLCPKLEHERLREIRLSLGLTQKAFASLLGYSSSRYALMEEGLAGISTALRLKLKEVVGNRVDAEIMRLQQLKETILNEDI